MALLLIFTLVWTRLGAHPEFTHAQQQMQNNHALYSLRGTAEWFLSCDVDEYVRIITPLVTDTAALPLVALVSNVSLNQS